MCSCVCEKSSSRQISGFTLTHFKRPLAHNPFYKCVFVLGRIIMTSIYERELDTYSSEGLASAGKTTKTR